MSKRTLAILMSLAVVCNVMATMITLFQSSGVIGAIGTIVSLVGFGIGCVALIGGLIKQARQRQWGWFVCTILFGIFCLAIYLIVLPDPPAYRIARSGERFQPQQHVRQKWESSFQPQSPQEKLRLPSQEIAPPESYQEAIRPEFYQEQRPSEVPWSDRTG